MAVFPYPVCVYQRSIAEIGSVSAPVTADQQISSHDTSNEVSADHVDQMESTSADPPCKSERADQEKCGNRSQSVDNVNGRQQEADQVDPSRESRNADQSNAVDQSGSVDDAHPADFQSQSVLEEEPVIRTTTSVQHATSADPPVPVKSMRSSMSVVQICSIVGIAFVSIAAVLIILRRARHSKV